MDRLIGKRAFVTGGRQGIGRAIVAAFAAESASVTTCGRGPRPDDLPDDVVWHRLDVSDVEAVAALACASPSIDILVNNAGVQVEKTVVDSSDADWDAVICPNCRGVFNMCRALIPAKERGAIINITTNRIYRGFANMLHYDASKGALSAMTRSMAAELGDRHIRVNAIAPGYTATDNTQALQDDPDRSKAILERIPAGRWGQPGDFAGPAVFLASAASDYVHGEILTVDGGWMGR